MTALARLVGRTPQMVRQWTLDGCPRRDDGSYVVAEVIAWLERRASARAERAAPTDEAEAKARKLSAEAELKELELATARRAVVPVEETQATMDALVGGFVASAKGQLQAFERDIVAAETPAAARKITDRIVAALMHGAQTYADTLEVDDVDG